MKSRWILKYHHHNLRMGFYIFKSSRRGSNDVWAVHLGRRIKKMQMAPPVEKGWGAESITVSESFEIGLRNDRWQTSTLSLLPIYLESVSQCETFTYSELKQTWSATGSSYTEYGENSWASFEIRQFPGPSSRSSNSAHRSPHAYAQRGKALRPTLRLKRTLSAFSDVEIFFKSSLIMKNSWILIWHKEDKFCLRWSGKNMLLLNLSWKKRIWSCIIKSTLGSDQRRDREMEPLEARLRAPLSWSWPMIHNQKMKWEFTKMVRDG